MDSINNEWNDAIHAARQLVEVLEFVRNGRELVLKRLGNPIERCNDTRKLLEINKLLLEIAKETDFLRRVINESFLAAFEIEQQLANMALSVSCYTNTSFRNESP